MLLAIVPAMAQTQPRGLGVLKPGRARQGAIVPGEQVRFRLLLSAGEFVRVAVEKKDVEMRIALDDAAGAEILATHVPNSAFGVQHVSAVSPRGGEYTLVVSAMGEVKLPGHYRAEAVAHRTPTEEDLRRVHADQIFSAALTTEDRSQAVAAFLAVAKEFEDLRDVRMQAVALHQAALVSDAANDHQKALDLYNQALPLRRLAHDRSGEAATLQNIGIVYAELREGAKALEYSQRALPLRHALPDRAGEAGTLVVIGRLYQQLGSANLPKARESFVRALAIYRVRGDRDQEGRLLLLLGNADFDLHARQLAVEEYAQAVPIFLALGNRQLETEARDYQAFALEAMGERPKALALYQLNLPIYRALKDREDEGVALNDIGAIYGELGQPQEALGYYQQALAIRKELKATADEASTLDNMGNAYSAMGDQRKALELYEEDLQLRRVAKDRKGESDTLNNMGAAYTVLSEKVKALDYYNQAMAIRVEVKDIAGQAGTLHNIGNVYRDLGLKDQALEYYSRALPLRRQAGDRTGEANTLNSIGTIYGDKLDFRKSMEYFQQALPILRATGDRALEAATLDNIGVAYSGLGDKKKALETYNLDLPIRRAASDPAGEAVTLRNIGAVYGDMGDVSKSLDFYSQALPLFRAVGNRAGEASTLSNLQILLKTAQPDLAIFFGKQAVNVLQTVRRDNRGLEDSLRRSYESSIESTYRRLAGLLVSRERFGEAEEVLDLLKNKEASDFIQRDKVSDQLRPATLLDFESKALERYEQISGQVVALGQKKAALLAKRRREALGPAELEEFNKIEGDLSAANAVLRRFLEEQQKTFAADSAGAKRVVDLKNAGARLQSELTQLGPDVVAIYTLVMPDQYIAMLVTGGVRKAYSTPIKESDLNAKIFEFRQQLQNPGSNPVPLAQELYRIVFPEGLRQDLDSMQAKTILWSIDSTLRYVPIAALHDGKDYLVTRFRNSLITPASRITDKPPELWQGVGFGVSEAKADFVPLPSVPEELHNIFRVKDTDAAPIPGNIRLNGEFTLAAFQNDLRRSNNSVVHIATHFDSRPGVAANSHLLLGDGSELSLAEIEASEQLFDGVDLLTLSACSTAFTNRSEDGREVDSFGEIAQRLGASGVIASLWSVNDEATARLMATMYRLHQENPAIGKSEALRAAQEQMVKGALRPGTGDQADRGAVANRPAGAAPAERNWRHPFYWAPFILMGSWK
ncbi:MAG TPA: tetratricopeptide repeat protein [Bryobacteraceae bacterium]